MGGCSNSRLIAAWVVVALLAPATPATAQLISPGKLSAPHAGLEGIEHCTDCHQLRERGIVDAKCLACHTPLARLMREETGYHAQLRDRNCAECHKEHFGEQFQVVRLDTLKFDHRETGYPLEGSHADLTCRKCHTAKLVAAPDVREFKQRHAALDKTYLGLLTTCVGCHSDDNPHGTQFTPRTCDDCHSQRKWKPVPGFDHDSTRYVLTGRHRDVRCDQCHRPIPGERAPHLRYAGVRFSTCTDCHRDPHRASMGTTCTRCHTTAGWHILDRNAFERTFDHAKTGYRLEGKHASVSCSACHDPSKATRDGIRLRFTANTAGATYPKPASRTCTTCHTDYHEGAFADTPGGLECSSCHTQDGWPATTYDFARHDSTRFPLDGAHRAVPCLDCHQEKTPTGKRLRFRMEDRTCRSCHATADPHERQFADRKCDDCHVTATFRIATFDHTKTRFPLDGRHRDVACARCHPTAIAPDGRSFVRYRPLGTRCRDCHEAQG